LLFDLPGRHTIAIDGPISIEKLTTNTMRMDDIKIVDSPTTQQNATTLEKWSLCVHPNSPYAFNNATVFNFLGRKNASNSCHRFAKGIFICQVNRGIIDNKRK
jgi:hypothetical protein